LLNFHLFVDPYATIHVSQILVGFELLARQGVLSYSVTQKKNSDVFGHPLTVTAECGGVSMAFDCHDDGLETAAAKVEKAIEKSGIDHYFKRSYCGEYYGGELAARVHPLGMNYHVSCKGNRYNQIHLRDVLKISNRVDLHNVVRKVVARLPVSGRLYDGNFDYKNFENPAYENLSGAILFLSRTWFPLAEMDPQNDLKNVDSILKKYPNLQYIFDMDETRAELIRALKREFGARVTAGFSDNDFARKKYPGLIADAALTDRHRYLERMKKSQVCLTTEGLVRSTGWKMAEYVAAGRAIVCEPPFYETTGDFGAGANYLGFASVDEALAGVHTLLSDGERCREMMRQNKHYYENYLSPDNLVMNAIEKAFS